MREVTRLSIPFDAQRVAWAVRVPPDIPPAQALTALRLPPYDGVVVVHGGAAMQPDEIDVVRRFLARSLVPFAEQRHLLVVDGGTHAGTMGALGDARQALGATFALLGVTPAGTVAYPGGPALDSTHYPLDRNHSHFILVESDQFGAESDLLVGLLRAAGKPGIALIINGGEIVTREVLAHVEQGNPLVTVRGTGRAADLLAEPGSDLRASLPSTAQVHTVDVHDPASFMALLMRQLRRPDSGVQ
jgi:hypothetical protein